MGEICEVCGAITQWELACVLRIHINVNTGANDFLILALCG